MNHIRLAKRYAKALFELAIERDVMEQVKTDMDLVIEIFENRDFCNMILSPIIRQAKKQDIISEIFKDKVSELSLLYIMLIIKKKRELVLKDIAEQYILIFKNTAVSLDSNLRKEIISLMEKETKKK